MRERLLRICGGLLAGLCVAQAVALRAQSAAVQEAFRQGATALKGGRNVEAEREFRRATTLDPNLPEAHLDLGLVLGREGKISEAVQSLKKALALNPSVSSANMFLGIFLFQDGQIGPAIEALKQELALNPKNEETLSWLGIVQLAAGHPELAVGPLDEAALLAPDDMNVLEYRGKAHSLVAQASYARMAQIDPDAWQVHKVRAELYATDNKDRDAVQEYQAALAREPRNADLYEGLGDAYRRMNELESAQAAYAHELELAPHNPIAMYNLGSTDIERGDYAGGLPLLRSMLAIYRSSPTAEYYLGRGLAESGKDAEAAEQLEKSSKEDGGGEVSKRSFYELARIYRKMHRAEDAQRTLAAYNLLREKETQQKAAKLADWRKINAGSAESSVASEPAQPVKP